MTKDGTMTGEVSGRDGKQGTWSVQKAKIDQRSKKTETSNHVMLLVSIARIIANRVVVA